MFSNFGVVIGPLLGGLLADPASNYPKLFRGTRWLLKFPYSPPSLFSALFVASTACAVFFCLQEVWFGSRNPFSVANSSLDA